VLHQDVLGGAALGGEDGLAARHKQHHADGVVDGVEQVGDVLGGRTGAACGTDRDAVAAVKQAQDETGQAWDEGVDVWGDLDLANDGVGLEGGQERELSALPDTVSSNLRLSFWMQAAHLAGASHSAST
jgi:hypothetical protein